MKITEVTVPSDQVVNWPDGTDIHFFLTDGKKTTFYAQMPPGSVLPLPSAATAQQMEWNQS